MGDNNFAIIINWKGDEQLLELPQSANVYDLRKAIEKATSVEPQHQIIDGLQIPTELLTDDFPLIALGLENVDGLLISSSKADDDIPTRETDFGPEDFVIPPRSRSPPPMATQPPAATQINANAVSFEGEPVAISGSDSTRLTEFLDRTAVDVDDWTANFERKYGFTHPIFTGGKFSEAIKVARDQYKLVVVNLHSKALDCKDFCSLVLVNPGLSEMLAENFILWVGHATDAQCTEAARLFAYTMQMKVKQLSKIPILNFPVTAIIGNFDGSVAVLDVMQGCLTADELMAKLYVALENTAPMFAKVKEARKKSEMQRSLIEEQDAAYKASLQRDADRQKQQEAQAKAAAASRESKLKVLSTARATALAKLAALAPEPKEGKNATIAIRLPDGSKIQRKFPVSDPFSNVLAFVEGTVASRLTDENFLDDKSSLENPEVCPWTVASYELASNFPKKRLTITESSKTLEELDLAPQILLHLQQASH